VSFIKVGKAPKPEKQELVHKFVGSFPSDIAWRLAIYVTFIDDSSKKV
jgi:hypothetical protein